MESKRGKVDYTLLEKRKIMEKLESLRGRHLNFTELNAVVSQILEMGDQVFSVCFSKIREEDRELLPIVYHILRHAKDPMTIKNIYKTLMDKNVSDEVKTRLLEVLIELGIDISELPLEEMIGDFEKMASDSMEKMLRDIEKDEFFISYVLEDIDTLSKDLQLTCIRDLGDSGDERAIPVLKALALSNDKELVLEAVTQLGRIKSPKTIAALTEIAEKAFLEEIKDEASKKIRKLKMQGIQEIVLNQLQPCVYKGIVSSIDGIGSRSLWFIWHHPYVKNKLCSLNILINIEEGVQDCWALPLLDSKDFNTALKELSKETEVLEDFQYAVTLLKDALYTSIVTHSQLPLSMGFWMGFFKGGDLVPQEYTPTLEYQMTIGGKDDQGLWETSDMLFETREFSDWFIAEPKVYEYAEEYLKIKKMYRQRKYCNRRLNKLYENFNRDIIKPKEDNILRMLELAYDFLVRKSSMRKARQVLTVINNFRKPCYQNPFLKRMIIESIHIALQNIEKGYDLRFDPTIDR